MTFDEWRMEVGIPKADQARKVWDDLFHRTLFEWRDIDCQRYVHVSKFEQNQDRGRKQIGAQAKAKKGRVEPELVQSTSRVWTELVQSSSEVGQKLAAPLSGNNGLTSEKRADVLLEDVPLERSNVNGNVPFPEGAVLDLGAPVAPAPPPQPQSSGVPNGTERNCEMPRDGPTSQAISTPAPSGVPNGTERQSQHANDGSARGGGAGATGAPRRLDPRWRRRTVQEMASLTRDFHSAARWEQFVEAFFKTRQGEDALIRICKGLRERIAEQRAPGNPGAWLNSALLKTAVELGISLERTNGATAHAGHELARRSG